MADGPSFLGEEVDLCVVGSGAGGAPIAHALSGAGAKVVVLEKGPWYQKEDFDHDEIKNARRDMWAPLVMDEPHLQTTEGGPRQPTNNGWIANNVGGGTVHMSGYFYRLHPEDFRLGRRYAGLEDASVADWPIGYEELAPYYDKVEKTIGVSGAAGAHPFEPPRSGPYPLPPVATNPLAKLVEDGARKKGWHPFQIPRAVLSRPYKGRSGCVYCDYCGSYGCESGAKSSTLAALVPEAVATGRCEIRPHSMAFEVVIDAKGRASGVRYYDSDGKAQMQKARVVCLAATSIETARLLLNSRPQSFPDGVANGSGLVGRNLSFSTLAKGFGEFERAKLPKGLQPVPPNHFLDRAIQDHYFIDGESTFDKGGTIHYILPHRNAIYTAERLAKRHEPMLWGEALTKEIQRYYAEVHQVEFEIFGEFLPGPKTFVSVDGDTKDKFGIPVATIHLQRHPAAVRNARTLASLGVQVFEAAGAESTWTDAVGGTTYVLQHGTCRFGSDPSRSVLDPDCRSHEVKNLYVTDGSFMPSSGGVPTTLTILANAFRVADKMIEHMKG
ncbi:MAG: GMC family oxidoreductase [Myxococcota bacterium]